MILVSLLHADMQAVDLYLTVFSTPQFRVIRCDELNPGYTDAATQQVAVYDNYHHSHGEQQEILSYVHASFVPLIVIGAPENPPAAARFCLRAGAAEYLLRPAAPRLLVRRTRYLAARYWSAALHSAGSGSLMAGISGAAPMRTPGPCTEVGDPMQAVRQKIERYAARTDPIVITGESGVGKDVAARRIHALSPRCNGPLVPINCGAIPEQLFESEMFGVVRGAFTDSCTRTGAVRSADKGTLFLDEVAELSPAGQAALLRVLEQRSVRAVGADKPVPVDFRLIAATNKDLWSQVEAGRFREDLYYRLMVLHIELPPLRHRKGDIPQLLQEFLELDFPDTPVRFSAAAVAAMVRYDWPGNIRELRNMVNRAVVDSESCCIEPSQLSLPGTSGFTALSDWAGVHRLEQHDL
ncbi:sigma 54-interacting transcriptional regulator [Spirochaeta africana]|uniref:Response regulator with CheY-like receiver, AAA-type ATPase, and DNA-binding domains n=1 Tax=Spirochaeta africana (strain ATCC 700263 / DSM 8902 / Z-7692) TaxID=889378 RepID=H9UMQ5_SPIAZ|nr:sigma-54 dependent transcriptional regulator [Spirochaeta africana]AFG38798.1 response regulator with CheY-like receiver, AAA-type ATPase, and DNA-binding domains [Spirochaeta africana DSM 8902]